MYRAIPQSKPLTVAVVSTCRSGSGSMARYYGLIVRVLREQGVHVRGLSLACPVGLSGSAGVWLNHAWIWLMAASPLRHLKGVDLIHLTDGSYAYAVPRKLPIPVVVTAHDVIPWLQSQRRLGISPPGVLARQVIHSSLQGLRRTAHVVADSRCTADDLVLAGVPPADITPVYPALALTGADLHGDRAGPFLLHVGNSGFYKNRITVLRVFAALRSRRGLRLVLAGSPLTDAEQAELARLGIGEHVDCRAGLSDEKLRCLYATASVFLFPSLYEGFGWPPLEAMAHGCPVVCSNGGSLPEVVGDSALRGDARDVEGLVNLCARVLDDDGLRKSLIRRGKVNVTRFTEEKMGVDLLAVYRRVLNGQAVTVGCSV